MMTRSLRLLLASLGVVLLLVRPVHALGITGGDVPLPSKTVDGTLKVSWDGTYADLLAADALAMCWITQSERLTRGTSTDPDPVISFLASKITAAQCSTATCTNSALQGTPADAMYCAWVEGRKSSACNIDAAAGTPASLDVTTLRAASETAAYVFPTAAALGLSGSAAATVRNSAREELQYAELSLCMAEQLRQKLDTVQVAFASGDDLRRVQDRIRERSLTAVFQYSVVAKAITATGTPPTAINDAAYYIAPLTIWGRGSTSPLSSFTRFGDDFAESINVLIESTEGTVEQLLRQPQAQRSLGEYDFANFAAIGTKGPRTEVMKAMYDGYSATSPVRRAVLTDMSAPEVGVLLGLARKANALKISLQASLVDRLANAKTLLLTVENYVRSTDCTVLGQSPCTLATVSTPLTSYVSSKRYGVRVEHAKTLVEAFTSAIFGPPQLDSVDATSWRIFPNPFYADVNGPYGPAEQLAFHLLGNHTYSGTIVKTSAATATGTVTIDPAFSVVPLRSDDVQALRGYTRLPTKTVNALGNALPQILNFRSSPRDGGPTAPGVSSVLALARESIAQMASLSTSLNAYGFYQRAQTALPAIEGAIGKRQVLIRANLASTANSGACTSCVLLVSATASPNYTIEMLTQTADPAARFAAVNGIPQAATLVRDTASTTIWGTTGTAITTSPTYTAFTNAAVPNTNYQFRSGTFHYTSSVDHGITVLLRLGASAPFQYEHVFTGRPVSSGANGCSGTSIAYGGHFAKMVRDAWAFKASNWSMPLADAFGLPTDWSPAPDAALLGNEGASVEQHFISRASTAANEATAALQQAFDTLQQEVADETAVASSEARAQELNKLEMSALCGAATTCAGSYVNYTPTAPACASGNGQTDCNALVADFSKVVGEVPISKAVSDQLGATTPDFSQYDGGQLQSLFIQEWNAVNAVLAAMSNALGSRSVASEQLAVAQTEKLEADAYRSDVEGQIQTATQDLTVAGANISVQIMQYTSAKNDYDGQVSLVQAAEDQACSESAFSNAEQAGWTHSGDDLAVIDDETNFDANGGWKYHVTHRNSQSWSAAPGIAQVQQCQAAKAATAAMVSRQSGKQTEMDEVISKLNEIAKNYDLSDETNVRLNGFKLTRAAATARVTSAKARVTAAEMELASQAINGKSVVQAAFGQLIGAIAAVRQAYSQAGLAMARTSLEAQQATYDVRSRFGVRKRFHSYDLWRARALSENARRLAIAARRAIESRYVVRLSEMKASEPFVDAPAIWADEIYGSDLKPPVSLGVTKSPTTASGVYTNKLTDYVNNLKLFVDGYVVERPTAQVPSDAEVVQLPGPSPQVAVARPGGTYAYIDPSSMGWTFYCPATSKWITHPQGTAFSLIAPIDPEAPVEPTDPERAEKLQWMLETACAGKPPARARLLFSLDPWGRLSQSTANSPYVDRYNVRTGNLALNVVGTGVRDCSKVGDPASCYSEPFIDFSLEHVGPTWVTNFDQEWRSQDIPTAHVEGGKALTAEEWLDPVSNGFSRADVQNVTRFELRGRPIGGAYTLTLELTPDVRVEMIERLQLLIQTSYWVRQN